MAKKVKPLTYREVARACPREKAYKLFDGGGLFIQVNPSGSKYWKMKLRQHGREMLLSFGKYPELSLTAARRKRDEIRIRQQDAQNGLPRVPFERVARDWLEIHATKVSVGAWKWYGNFLEKRAFPILGKIPVRDLRCPDFLDILRTLEDEGHYSNLKRARSIFSLIMRHAVACGLADYDPIPSLKNALRIFKPGHYAAPVDPAQVGIVLRLIEDSGSTLQVKSALQLLPYLFVRPGELCMARWAEIDLERREWRYTTGKTQTQHIVPLCAQAMRILTQLRQKTGDEEYVFTLRAPKPIHRDALREAMRKAGIPASMATPHGFRATARTLLEEVLGERYELIEQQLAHRLRDPNGRAYNRTTNLKERKRMMERWGLYLDNLRRGSLEIPPFNPSEPRKRNSKNFY